MKGNRLFQGNRILSVCFLLTLPLIVGCGESPSKGEPNQPRQDQGSAGLANAAVEAGAIAAEQGAADLVEKEPSMATSEMAEEEGSSPAEETAATKAWLDLARAAQQPAYPHAWLTRAPTEEEKIAYRNGLADQAVKAAKKAARFVTDYPKDDRVALGVMLQRSLLMNAIQFGATNVWGDYARLNEQLASDEERPVSERVTFFDAMIEARFKADPELGDEAKAEALRSFREAFPNQELPYQKLTQFAMRSDSEVGARIKEELLADETLPAPFKVVLERGGQPEGASMGGPGNSAHLGSQPEINFTSLDGQSVSLKDYQGKVVLLDFWATWCGPCVRELPKVKKAYAELGPKGFEIIGISLDQDKGQLKAFLTKEKVPWPQHFDGKGWKNEFAQTLGIRSIPAMWLIDQQGVVVDVNARAGLVEKVNNLLENAN